MTLQEHFNAIKNGKGNKVQFLKQARSLFPQYLNQYSDFNTSINVLKSKQIINEAVGGVVTKGFNITNWKQIFEAEVKAEEKAVSKEAADANKSAYQPSNVKNADNINFNEILKGYLAELGDVKNAGKTGDELKAIAVKNLTKDPLFYTKNGEFGIKGVGYTTEVPGLGEPKEAKGKHKSSGYGDIDKEIKVKANVKDSLGNQEAKDSMPKKVKEMTTTPQNSAGVKKMKMPGTEKTIKLNENLDAKYTPSEEYKYAVECKYLIGFQGKDDIKYFKSEEEAKNYAAQKPIQRTYIGLYNQEAKNYKDLRLDKYHTSLNESKLRSVIAKLIKENLGHNEISSITPEGRFWIVTYRTMNGIKEKLFNSEKEAQQFLMNQDTDPNLGEPIEEQKLRSVIAKLIKEELKRSNISGSEYIEINGKVVRTYTQNEDKSYNVTYDDGTKDTIMVSNDAWNEIHDLHKAYN